MTGESREQSQVVLRLGVSGVFGVDADLSHEPNLLAKVVGVRLVVHPHGHLADSIPDAVRRREHPLRRDERAAAEMPAGSRLQRDKPLVLPRVVDLLAANDAGFGARHGRRLRTARGDVGRRGR